jgi:hypothetical protein
MLSAGRLYSLKYVSNPFISLVERIKPTLEGELRTILCGEHSQLSALGNIKRIETDSTWLQVIHGKNISNRVRGIRQPIQKLINNRFAIDIAGLPHQENLLLYWLDKTWSLLKQPLEWAVRQLPSGFRLSIKKLLA